MNLADREYTIENHHVCDRQGEGDNQGRQATRSSISTSALTGDPRESFCEGSTREGGVADLDRRKSSAL